MRRFAALTVALLIGSLLHAAPALAVPPESMEVSFEGVVEDLDGEQCGFPIRWEIVGTADQTMFFSSSGDLVRIQAHVREDNEITRLDTGEVVRDGPLSFNQRVEFLPDGDVLVATAGIFNHSGRGADQVRDIGRFLWLDTDGTREVVFAAGHHALLDESEDRNLQEWLGAFCDLF